MVHGVPGGSAIKNPPSNAEDAGLIPGSGRSLEEENGNSLQSGRLQSMRSHRVRHDLEIESAKKFHTNLYYDINDTLD